MIIEEVPAIPKPEKQVRVAAYARVSSDKDAAFHSLTAQKEYYEEYVSHHPNWVLVGLYSDNGISGTTTERPEFQRMLSDARNGAIDLIVTKSITRFARNTVILLETIRELKRIGVDCYFEKEDMHSISPDGELLLTLLGMYAEEEARSASENQKWRVKKRFEQGKPWVGDMLGYRLVNGEMVIVPEEAEIVRKIFSDYLFGKGLGKIARTLTELGIPSKQGRGWAVSTISKILKNEKYKGDMLLQKTFHENFITKRKIDNHGELPRYYVKHSHKPIIDPEQFDAVQQEMKRRKEEFEAHMQKHNDRDRKGSLGTSDSDSDCHIGSNNGNDKMFNGLIVCGDCGGKYRRRYTNGRRYRNPVWICHRYLKIGKSICASQQIPEPILIAKTKEVLGVTELSREVIIERIDQILVPEHNHLVYILKDGSKVDVLWEHASRSKSWTPEMKEAARQRALKQNRKEES